MTTRRAPHEIAPSNTDGDFFRTIDGAAGWGPAPAPPTPAIFLPLTTKTGGAPELVWDSNDELVLTEVIL